MRIRSTKPEFWRDEITGHMEPALALFYLGLACFADDQGRFEWNAALMRADLDPYDAKWGGVSGIETMLDRLLALKRVVRYMAEGRSYGFIPTQTRHQHPNRPTPSRLPSPPPPLPESSVSPHGALIAGDGDGEGDGGGEKLAATANASPPSSAPKRVRSEKKADPRHRPLREKLCAIFQEARGTPYLWQGVKDAKALNALLPRATDDEIEGRWRAGLAATGWKETTTVAQLRAKWNEHAPKKKPLPVGAHQSGMDALEVLGQGRRLADGGAP